MATCPLTGTPAPGGTVPARPALGVKIGNYPGDRPSAGLNQADIVFEEPVEGAITRLVAVFQCQGAALVGDLRSAREPDVAILSQLSDPLFVHAGGIDPVIALLAQSPRSDENLYVGTNGSATIQPAGPGGSLLDLRQHRLAVGLRPHRHHAPGTDLPLLDHPARGPVAGSGASVAHPVLLLVRRDLEVEPDRRHLPPLLLGHAGHPARRIPDRGDQRGRHDRPTATGPWVENSEGGQEVEVTATGSGPLVVMRNGVAITGTWSRSSLTHRRPSTAANGTPITLQPGNTWEELVPAGVPVTTTAATPTASATTTKAP